MRISVTINLTGIAEPYDRIAIELNAYVVSSKYIDWSITAGRITLGMHNTTLESELVSLQDGYRSP